MSASEFKFLVDVGVGKNVEQYLLEKYAENMKDHFCVYQNKKFRFRKLSRVK